MASRPKTAEGDGCRAGFGYHRRTPREGCPYGDKGSDVPTETTGMRIAATVCALSRNDRPAVRRTPKAFPWGKVAAKQTDEGHKPSPWGEGGIAQQ